MRSITGSTIVAIMIGIVSGGLVQSGVIAQNNLIEPIASPGMIFEVLALNKDLATKKKPKYRSPAQLIPSRDKTKMYIVEQSRCRCSGFRHRKTERQVNAMMICLF